MPYYYYVGMTADGAQVRSGVEADDLPSLLAHLAQEKLFLVSWQVERRKRPEVPSTSANPESLPPIPFKRDEVWNPVVRLLKTPRGLRLFIALMGLFAAVDWYYFTHFAQTNPYWIPSTSPESAKFSAVHLGMKRRDAEKILPPRMDYEPSLSVTKYVFNSGVLISVDYDSTGGPGSPENLVVLPPSFELVGQPAKAAPDQ